jgi:hypothetical protein
MFHDLVESHPHASKQPWQVAVWQHVGTWDIAAVIQRRSCEPTFRSDFHITLLVSTFFNLSFTTNKLFYFFQMPFNKFTKFHVSRLSQQRFTVLQDTRRRQSRSPMALFKYRTTFW